MAVITCGNVHKHIYAEFDKEIFRQYWVNEF